MIRHAIVWTRSNLWAGIRQVVVLVSWAAVYLVVLLAAFAGVIKVASGWDAVVVTSGSMSPTLRIGDVVFIDDHPDQMLGQRTVITFERVGGDDGLVTHRVFETLAADESYVTKGDANPTPDADAVHRDDVVGVGRLVVPFLGLPVVWAEDGNTTALAALGVLALAAMAAVVMSFRRGRDSQSDAGDRFSSTAQRGIGRVRLVVALMIAMQLLIEGRQFQFDALGLNRIQTLLTALLALGAISLIGNYRSRSSSGSRAQRLAMVELVGDTLVVVFFVAASGSTGIGWVLMALPIIEAAIHFRLTGAFIHWMVMCGLTTGAFFWTSVDAGTPQSVVIDDLGQLVDRLGVLLLVVIPGSYLAEQLLGDVLTQRRATRRAHERSRIIEHVTEAGQEVTRLGGELFESLVRATMALGFDAADVWVGNPTGGWKPLATDDEAGRLLPRPGDSGSALRAEDLDMSEVAIDVDDPYHEEYEALADAGAEVLVRITLARQGDVHIVLRAAAVRSTDDPASQIMALRLLSGQAAVALQNERLVTELRQTHAELEHQALYDPLTGLANRAHFVGLLGEALRNDGELHQETSVMFLDLNGFKAVNDRLGHNAGDELLAAVGARLVAAVDGRGLVARLGGDEFTVLLDEEYESYVVDEIADAVHLALSEPFDIADDRARVGASIGIAYSEPYIGVSEMLRRADVAMYAAKGKPGAWRTMTYQVELDENERRSERLANDFGAALKAGQLHMAYQPILDAVAGSMVGVEALIRWIHPELGSVSAPAILDTAEVTGSVDELNAWIFKTSLTDVASCDAEPFIAVNVSPHEVELDTLVDNMLAALATSGVPPSRVVVELSERMVAEARGSIGNVNRLTALGLDLALDDFGQGQTSLAHLRGLPITYLKLDRLFIQHAGESSEDRQVLESVVGLAHDLGFSVIAEGIETPDHHAIVTHAGADLVQGYGLHRPMPIADLRELLHDTASSDGTSRSTEFGTADHPITTAALPAPLADAERVG